jgi:hypothetical protein
VKDNMGAVHVACMEWGKKNAYRSVMGNSEGKNHYDDLDIGVKDIVKMGLKKMRWVMDYIDLPEDRDQR